MPQAILLEDVDSLGAKGTVVDVSSGYLRNFLLPRKLAEAATAGSIEAAESIRYELVPRFLDTSTKRFEF